ncbi:LOW QUALITY PROTEIN: hypothetical protein ACHAW6_015163 [Cyclotella cf. meneghiniana]
MMQLKIKNVWVAYDVLADGVVPPSVHQYMKCHMIIDIKMEVFVARLVNGDMTKAPTTLASLLVAALNNVDIWAADVLNAYITAPFCEKIWSTLGNKFGENCGRKAIIVQALYGLKSSGAAFRAYLAGCLHEMVYCPSPTDCDLWLKEQTDRKGNHYYANILC